MTIECITTEDIRNYTELSGELWLPVKGMNSRYYVSNMGRVLTSVYYSHRIWALLTPARSGKSASKGGGYPQVVLYREDGSKYRAKVHRLVAEHFIPNPNNFSQVNHKNMDTMDNRVENLEWCANTYNQQHYRANTGKLSMEKAKAIRARWAETMSYVTMERFCQEVAREYNVSRNTIRFLLNGQTWKS
jgi:hypothetical protein